MLLSQDRSIQFEQDLTHLIAVKSVKSDSTESAPYGIGTLEALNVMFDIADRYGFTHKNLDGRVGYIEWGQGLKYIAILSHLDIVPPGPLSDWSTDPYALTLLNGYYYGRGIVDDKGPALAALYGMIDLKESGYEPPCRIRLILGLDEEHGSSCVKHYLEHEPEPEYGFTPDADFPAIFAEKGILQIEITSRGNPELRILGGDAANMVPASCEVSIPSLRFAKKYIGKSAHASTPEKGDNAIIKAISDLPIALKTSHPFLSFIETEFISNDPRHRLFSTVTSDFSGDICVNIGMIELADTFGRLIIDVRYPVTENSEKILSCFRAVLDEASTSISVMSHLLPLHIGKHSAQMTALLKIYESYLEQFECDDRNNPLYLKFTQGPVQPIAIGGGTYARSMPNIIPFGPYLPWENATLHQKDECYKKSHLLTLIDVYRDAIRLLSELTNT